MPGTNRSCRLHDTGVFRPVAADGRGTNDRCWLPNPGRTSNPQFSVCAAAKRSARDGARSASLREARPQLCSGPRNSATIRQRRCRAWQNHGTFRTYAPAAICAREVWNRIHDGAHVLPDASAAGTPRGEHLYTIRFDAAELWPEVRSSQDCVFVDLWESYLETV
ncbi:MAG: nitrile hydratase subunit beta [Mesorhizobium sp.]|nr:MAG: nitrile hydratase subunit beta [Mesorhizobium sp.]